MSLIENSGANAGWKSAKRRRASCYFGTACLYLIQGHKALTRLALGVRFNERAKAVNFR